MLNKTKVFFLFLLILILVSCNSQQISERPSPKDVAQFDFDIYNKNYEAVKNAIAKNKEILNIGYEYWGIATCYPIHASIISKDADMVKLIASKRNVNIPLKFDDATTSPLMYALMTNCNSEIIKTLIDLGADTSITDDYGINIFHHFAITRDKDVWKVLRPYANKKNLNKKMTNKCTPLVSLITAQFTNDDLNNPEVINLLKDFIELGGNPNYLIYFEDAALEVVNFLNENKCPEYKQVLLEGMKNNPQVGKSKKLIEILESTN